ncbi:MAG: hypothetical protein WCK73_04980, partial [Deltaproteobacteria bacterium]
MGTRSRRAAGEKRGEREWLDERAVRKGFTRRQVLKTMAAAGAAAGASPLLSATGCAPAKPKIAMEARNLYFNFSHLNPDHHDFVLEAGNATVELSRTSFTELSAARKSNGFLARVLESKLTHHVKDVEVPAQAILACHVKMYPRGSRASWKFALMFWSHPEESVRLAHARMPVEKRNTLSLKAQRAGLLGSAADIDPVEEAAYHDASSQAVFMASLHPEILVVEPTASAHVQQSYLQRSNPSVSQLASHINDNPDTWADLEVITDDDGVPFTDDDGNVIQLPHNTDSTNLLLGSAIATASNGVKSDPQLGWYASSGTPVPDGAIWVVNDGQTHVDQSPSPTAPSALGAALRPPGGPLGATEASLVFPEYGKHKGYRIEAGETETDPVTGDRTVKVKFKNYYCRHLGVYVRYLDADNQPIPLSSLSAFTKRNAHHYPKGVSLEATNYDTRIAMLGPVFTILGIPSVATSAEATVRVPAIASAFQVIAEGIGTGATDHPNLHTGKVLTAILDLTMPMLFLATLATTEFSAWAKTESRQRLLSVLEFGEDMIGPIIELSYSGGKDGLAWWEFSKVLVENLLSMFLTFAKTAWWTEEILGYIGLGEIRSKIPVIGLVCEAIAAATTVATLTQTVEEISSSPTYYINTGVYEHDIEITIFPDPLDPKGFPAVATHYTVSAICKRLDASGKVVDQASPITYTAQMGSTQVTDPLHVRLTVPYGGSIEVTVGFYSDTGWLAGQGTTGVLDNTEDTFQITIQENLVPLIATTYYHHKEKTTIDANGNHSLVGTDTAPRVPASCVDSPGVVCAVTSLTNLNTAPGGVGYAWQSYSDPKKFFQCGGTGGTGQLYGFANIGVTARPQNGYLAASCGLMGPVRVAYALTGSNVMNFYLDDKNYIRQIRLTGNTPSYDSPLSRKAFGRLNFASDAFFVTNAGKVISVNHGASKIESLWLPSQAVSDAIAPLATAAAGPGTRPGLLNGPLCSGLMADDTLLILEGGANQVQAFDSAGNSVPKFPRFANPYAFPLSRYPATDANGLSIRIYTDMAVEYRGYIFLFSYPVSNPSLQSLDIYDPEGVWVCRTMDLPGAKFTVSFWRDLYAGNYETLHNPVTGLYE